MQMAFICFSMGFIIGIMLSSEVHIEKAVAHGCAYYDDKNCFKWRDINESKVVH